MPAHPPLHRLKPSLRLPSGCAGQPIPPAEAQVWARVRNHQLGFRIRRQHPIAGRFLNGFYYAARQCIEIDGDSHTRPDQDAHDADRTARLSELGYRVIRFSNQDVRQNLAGVLEAICEACRDSGPPPPALRRPNNPSGSPRRFSAAALVHRQAGHLRRPEPDRALLLSPESRPQELVGRGTAT